MFYSFMEMIKKITVFMVICVAILQLMPGKSYEKYMKPLIGFMLLTRIVIAIFSFQGSDIKKEMEDTIIQYEKELQNINIQNTAATEIDVTAEISNKLNDDIINGYRVEKAIIIEEQSESKLIIYLREDIKEISVERIQLSEDKITDERLVNQIAQILDMETKSIEVVIET